MKSLLLFSALGIPLISTAQWSTDPAAPMIVSNAANDQRYMRAIADADSGYYVFWSDLRSNANKADLYGQHFDSEGNALWTANGELLMTNAVKSINQMAALLMPDGSVIVAYITGATNICGDTLRAMRFDESANTLWAEPAVLLTGQDYRNVQVVASDSCAYVVAYCNSCGVGGYGCKMQRVRMDGSVLFALPGQTTNSSYHGTYTVHPDGVGGILFNIRCANGAGTCLKAQRFDSLGTAVWPNYIDLADASGLQHAFSTTVDSTGAMIAAWEVGAADVRMARIDTLGNALWSPAVLPACDLAVHVQQDPVAMAAGNELFVAWEDNRPPAANSDLYIQKYDLATGAELWAADGVPAIQINTFIPTTGMVLSDSGGVVVTFDGNLDGYSAMRLRDDGTQAWPEPVTFCASSFNPFYEQRVHLPDGNGGVVAFWQSFLGDLYGARIYRSGKLYNDVGIAEANTLNVVRAYPNPAADAVHVDLPSAERIVQLEVINAQGHLVPAAFTGRTVDLRGIAQGSYVARIHTGNNIFIARIIKH